MLSWNQELTEKSQIAEFFVRKIEACSTFCEEKKSDSIPNEILHLFDQTHSIVIRGKKSFDKVDYSVP